MMGTALGKYAVAFPDIEGLSSCCERFVDSQQTNLRAFNPYIEDNLPNLVSAGFVRMQGDKITLSHLFINLIYDVCINEGILRLSTALSMQIKDAMEHYHKHGVIPQNHERILGKMYLVIGGKPSLAMHNIYNCFFYSHEDWHDRHNYKTGFKGINKASAVYLMKVHRVPQPVSQFNNNPLMVKLVGFGYINNINKNGRQFYILSPHGQRTIYTRRINSAYNLSGFIYL